MRDLPRPATFCGMKAILLAALLALAPLSGALTAEPAHDPAPTPAPTALLLNVPAGADRAVWLDGVSAGLRTVGAPTTFDVTNASCALSASWQATSIPTHDVPCPCSEPAEGRSCYLVRWVEAPAPVATR